MTETQPKARPRPLKTAKYLLWGVLLCAVIGLVCFWGGRMSAGEGKKSLRMDAVVIENQLAEISELATVSYHYTNMAQFESSNDFYGVKLPFTTKSFILTYDGEIKAGVDLNQAEVKVAGDTITIQLPAAKILSHQIEEDSMEVFDEKTSIFNPFLVEDFSAFQTDQKAVMEAKSLEKGLLTQAGDKARASVKALLVSFLPEDISITVV